MKVYSKLLSAFVWALPFMISGFSAPFIFRYAPTPQIGGHYAGTLFIFAGIWAILLSIRHRYKTLVKIYLMFFFLLELVFWTWRYANSLPLRDSFLLGVNGAHWHSILTTLYLVALICLFSSEFRKSF